MRTADLSGDLQFTIACPQVKGDWGWCSKGCFSNLNVAYAARKQDGAMAVAGTLSATGDCAAPSGDEITCRFAQHDVGKVLGTGRQKLLRKYADVSWTNILGKQEVGLQLFDPTLGRRPKMYSAGRTIHVPAEAAVGAQVIASVDAAIASLPAGELDAAANESERAEVRAAQSSECVSGCTLVYQACIQQNRCEAFVGSARMECAANCKAREYNLCVASCR